MTFVLQGVSRRFDGRAGRVAALDGVSLEVAPGERLVVLGPSGAGKTTLFGVLNTTLRPSEGTVLFEGRDVSQLSRRALRAVRRRIGTVFQQPRLVPSLTTRQNALLGRVGHWSFAEAMRAWARPSSGDLARVEAALGAVGLLHRAAARGDELSGGEQQRVAIARVLVQEPTTVLADEPFSSLDPALRDSMGELLLGVAARDRTLVAVMHDVDFALRNFPRVVGLGAGRVMFDVPTPEVTPAMLDALYPRASPEQVADARRERAQAVACAR
ncbi:MAG TPA: ATP-binding cassette domain-containing protein [Myxococcaceae bacterium]|nr:ATP-binding cassette domain-containing protein [Myxococcaceae bacterium]